MPRQPIHVERTGLLTPRDRMWRAMKSLVTFTPRAVQDMAGGVTLGTVCDYTECLVAGGYVRKVTARTQDARAKFTSTEYLVEKFSAFTPALAADGRPIAPAIGMLAMWRAMKVRKVFDADLVSRDASQGKVTCTLATAKSYLLHLARAGYLRPEVMGSNKRGASQLTRYRLVRDTGPLPPAVTRVKAVYDRNTGELHLAQTAQEVCDAVG